MVEALGFYVYKRFSCREEVNGSEEKQATVILNGTNLCRE